MAGLWLAVDHMTQRRCNSLVRRYGLEFFGIKTRGLFLQGHARRHVDMLRSAGAGSIWVDIKDHETPDSAVETAEIVARAGAQFITVHASGGLKMMEGVVGTGLHVYVVTILSSLTDFQAARYYSANAVGNMIQDAVAAGVTGLICAPKKVKWLRQYLMHKFPNQKLSIVSPGTRFADDEAHDQEQVETPGVTLANGADFLVIGRMLTAAKNPSAVMRRLKAEIEGGR
jgi:orotidine-5'-phosphate decarboxylase